MRKLFSILKRWYSDKELVVLSGKETFVLILIFSACFLFLTVQSAVYRHRRDQNFQKIWEGMKRLDQQLRESAQHRDQQIQEIIKYSKKTLEDYHRCEREKKELYKKKSK